MEKNQTKEQDFQDLKDTLLQTGYEEVHFDAQGRHYLHVKEHGKKKYGRLSSKSEKNEKTGNRKRVMFPINDTEIVKSVESKKVIAAESIDELLERKVKKSEKETEPTK